MYFCENNINTFLQSRVVKLKSVKKTPPNVTGFWKISLNVTFYYSNIYNQNEEQELPINLKVVTMCSSYLKLPENNWKYLTSSVILLLWSQ